MSAPADFRSQFLAWLKGWPDDFILRRLLAVMIAATAVVLALDYRQLAEETQNAAVSTPQLSTELPPAALPREDGEPALGPLRRADPELAAHMSFDLVGDGRLLATGTIEPGTAKAFADEVEKRGSYIKSVVLHSPGGSVSDALEMGRLIRNKQFSTEVKAGRYCASSCPLVFAGGVERRAGQKAVIGVHQVSVLARDGLTPVAGMEDAQRVSAACQRYLRDMGVDLEVWTRAMETPKEKLYRFKKDELLGFKLATDVGGGAKTASSRARARL
ncbi:MAG: hypothetical protein WD073_00875 [Xanthobacteraceae bacterium]